jgi:hypothetical protein
MSLFGVGQDGSVLRLAGVFTVGIVVNVSIVLDRLLSLNLELVRTLSGVCSELQLLLLW